MIPLLAVDVDVFVLAVSVDPMASVAEYDELVVVVVVPTVLVDLVGEGDVYTSLVFEAGPGLRFLTVSFSLATERFKWPGVINVTSISSPESGRTGSIDFLLLIFFGGTDDTSVVVICCCEDKDRLLFLLSFTVLTAVLTSVLLGFGCVIILAVYVFCVGVDGTSAIVDLVLGELGGIIIIGCGGVGDR
jgi:hypothetical protein